MLTAEIASTTAKPSMTLARKRKVGNLSDIDRGQTRFNDATRTPVFFLKTLQTRQRRSRIQC